MTPEQVEAKFPTPEDFAAMLDKAVPGKKLNGTSLPGGTLGEQWLNWQQQYAKSYPTTSLGTEEQQFLEIIAFTDATGAIARAVTKEAQGTAQFTAASDSATVQGLDQVGKDLSVGGFLAGLTSGNLWVRVAKVAIGGVILVVGLAKLTGADQKAPAIVRTAVKAAPLL